MKRYEVVLRERNKEIKAKNKEIAELRNEVRAGDGNEK